MSNNSRITVKAFTDNSNSVPSIKKYIQQLIGMKEKLLIYMVLILVDMMILEEF